MVRKQLDDAGTSYGEGASATARATAKREAVNENRDGVSFCGNQMVDYEYADQSGAVLDNSQCLSATRPPPCNTQACSSSWVQTSTGTCSALCGGGVHSVEYACEIWWCPSQRKCSRYIVLLRTRRCLWSDTAPHRHGDDDNAARRVVAPASTASAHNSRLPSSTPKKTSGYEKAPTLLGVGSFARVYLVTSKDPCAPRRWHAVNIASVLTSTTTTPTATNTPSRWYCEKRAL